MFQLQCAKKLDEPLERSLVTIDPKEVDFAQVEEHVAHLSAVRPFEGTVRTMGLSCPKPEDTYFVVRVCSRFIIELGYTRLLSLKTY